MRGQTAWVRWRFSIPDIIEQSPPSRQWPAPRDAPRLAAIAKAWELAPNGHLLSGDVTAVAHVLDRWGVGRVRDDQTGTVAHAAPLYLVDGTTRRATPMIDINARVAALRHASLGPLTLRHRAPVVERESTGCAFASLPHLWRLGRPHLRSRRRPWLLDRLRYAARAQISIQGSLRRRRAS